MMSYLCWLLGENYETSVNIKVNLFTLQKAMSKNTVMQINSIFYCSNTVMMANFITPFTLDA